MILYLTSKRYMNILNFLQDEEELFIKKYVGKYNLNDFLGKSIQRLGHIETIVIDRTCLTDTNEQVIEAIKAFKSYSKIEIVFYLGEENENLFYELIGLGIFNIITKSEVEELREEIRLCLFEGMSERYVKGNFGLLCEDVKEIPFDFKEKQITIGVVGTQHRIGTTTIAMQFATYLKSIGANVSYVEANDSGHLKLIAEYYEMKKINDGYIYDDIAFEGINSTNKTVFDFIVYDLGVLDSKTMKGFINCDVRVVCAGNKPHELVFFQNGVDLLSSIEYSTIFNGGTRNNGIEACVAMPCNDILNDIVNQKILRTIIDNFLKGVI